MFDHDACRTPLKKTHHLHQRGKISDFKRKVLERQECVDRKKYDTHIH